MGSASIQRGNYESEYVYFLPAALVAEFGTSTGFIIESNGPGFTVRVSHPSVESGELQTFLNKHAAFGVNANKSIITADAVDSTTLTVAGKMNFNYTVLQENVEVASGSINDGQLIFATDEDGTYYIEIEDSGQTGYVKIVAVE